MNNTLVSTSELENTDSKKAKSASSVLNKYFGILPDFTLVSKKRNFKRIPSLRIANDFMHKV